MQGGETVAAGKACHARESNSAVVSVSGRIESIMPLSVPKLARASASVCEGSDVHLTVLGRGVYVVVDFNSSLRMVDALRVTS